MTLENGHIRLRAMEPEDLDLFYRWENDTSMWENSVSFSPYSKYMLKRYVEQTSNDIYKDGQLRLMIELKETRETVGCIDLFDFDAFSERACWGVLIEEQYRRKGYGIEALTALSDYCFATLRLRQLYCKIMESNIACLKMMEKTRFEQCGVLKSWAKSQSGFQNVYVFQQINPLLAD
jgi:diamine N-acetyltransferase